MQEIKILGTGCANCKTLHSLVEQVVVARSHAAKKSDDMATDCRLFRHRHAVHHTFGLSVQPSVIERPTAVRTPLSRRLGKIFRGGFCLPYRTAILATSFGLKRDKTYLDEIMPLLAHTDKA